MKTASVTARREASLRQSYLAVTLGDECPSTPWTASKSTPASSASVAVVLRQSCGRIRAMLDAAHLLPRSKAMAVPEMGRSTSTLPVRESRGNTNLPPSGSSRTQAASAGITAAEIGSRRVRPLSSDEQKPPRQINVLERKRRGLASAQAGGKQQAEQRPVPAGNPRMHPGEREQARSVGAGDALSPNEIPGLAEVSDRPHPFELLQEDEPRLPGRPHHTSELGQGQVPTADASPTLKRNPDPEHLLMPEGTPVVLDGVSRSIPKLPQAANEGRQHGTARTGSKCRKPKEHRMGSGPRRCAHNGAIECSVDSFENGCFRKTHI